jgi:nitrate reductase delta subunit
MKEDQQQPFFSCFSHLLDYPTENLAEQTRTCIDLIKRDYPQLVQPMENFQEFVENTPFGRLEELYTGTFDINPACHIFAGHILFSESFKRGAFMAGLEEEYQKRGFKTEKELSDHIPVLLKFLDTLEPDDSLANELISECLIPVFKKMNDNFKDDSTNPYVQVLTSVLVVFKNQV